MQETELFIHSAEIAGVFVGFGALIAIRSGTTMTTSEINAIRWVMTAGIWVVVVALAPTFIASYGLDGRELWLVSGLLALGFLGIVIVVFARTPENRAELQANVGRIPWRVMVVPPSGCPWPASFSPWSSWSSCSSPISRRRSTSARSGSAC